MNVVVARVHLPSGRTEDVLLMIGELYGPTLAIILLSMLIDNEKRSVDF